MIYIHIFVGHFMRDPVIRHAFHTSVLQSAHADSNTFVVDELGLKNGIARADIAVLNGHLVGYEIKGEKDNLTRLPGQIAAYSDVFEKAFIITSERHLEKVMTQIPIWWGVYLIQEKKNSATSFKRIRAAKLNKEQNAYAILQLLWKAEALEFANSLADQVINPYITKRKLYELICQKSSVQTITRTVISYLKQRENWRANLSPL